MKRLISAAVALSLLGATAASAAPAPNMASRALQQVDYRDHSYRHHDDGTGAAIGLGIGLFALGAILASQHRHDRDRWDDRDRDWRDRDYGYRNYDNRGYGGYGYSTPYRGW